jgi:hypothetical protein
MLAPFGLAAGLVHHPDVTWAWLALLAFSALAEVAAVTACTWQRFALWAQPGRPPTLTWSPSWQWLRPRS